MRAARAAHEGERGHDHDPEADWMSAHEIYDATRSSDPDLVSSQRSPTPSSPATSLMLMPSGGSSCASGLDESVRPDAASISTTRASTRRDPGVTDRPTAGDASWTPRRSAVETHAIPPSTSRSEG